jgi:hypothetical protein
VGFTAFNKHAQIGHSQWFRNVDLDVVPNLAGLPRLQMPPSVYAAAFRPHSKLLP